MASSILASLAAQIAGGAAAIYVDREFGAEYSTKIKLSDTNTLTITPGAMGAAALLVGLAFVPGSSNAMLKSVLAGLAGGALVYEGANLVEDQVFPLLGMPKNSVTGPQLPAPASTPVLGAYPGLRGVPRWQTSAALRSMGRAG